MSTCFLGGTVRLPFFVFAAAFCACLALVALACIPLILPCAIAKSFGRARWIMGRRAERDQPTRGNEKKRRTGVTEMRM